jgi:hypothetical protein
MQLLAKMQRRNVVHGIDADNKNTRGRVLDRKPQADEREIERDS